MSVDQLPRSVTVRRDPQSPIGVFHTPEIDLIAYPYHYQCTLFVAQLVGGTPNNLDVAAGWIATKLGVTGDEQIRAAAAQVMLDRGITDVNEAVEIVKKQRTVNGFKRDEKGLYLDARCAKAAIKEAVGVAVGAGKIEQRGWGVTQKWVNNFVAEHIFVAERKIYLNRDEPDGVNQQFVHGRNGSSIKYEEFVEDVELEFTIISDVDFDAQTPADAPIDDDGDGDAEAKPKPRAKPRAKTVPGVPNAKNTKPFWAMLWRTGEMQGIGASRSQGFGTYVVTRWERVQASFAK